MIAKEDREKIEQMAKAFAVKQVYLFGSSTGQTGLTSDIDLAVSGVEPAAFYQFYADLICALSKPVDLVDLDRDFRFTRMIREEGIILYEQAA